MQVKHAAAALSSKAPSSKKNPTRLISYKILTLKFANGVRDLIVFRSLKIFHHNLKPSELCANELKHRCCRAMEKSRTRSMRAISTATDCQMSLVAFDIYQQNWIGSHGIADSRLRRKYSAPPLRLSRIL